MNTENVDHDKYLFHNNEPLTEEEKEQLREFHLGNVTPENEKLFKSVHVRRGSGPVFWYIPYHYLYMSRNLQYTHKKLNGGKIPSAYWVRRKIKLSFLELGLSEQEAQKHYQYVNKTDELQRVPRSAATR